MTSDTDPILDALKDTQRRLATAQAETEQERSRRHRTEQLLDQAHRTIVEQTAFIETLVGRPARQAA